jgi:hypothetical protein
MTISIFIAQTPQEKENVYRFRYLMIAIGDEHPHIMIDHDQRFMYDEHDENATILYAKRDHKIVGTIRILNNTRVPLPKHLMNQFKFSQLENKLKPHGLSFTDQFFLDPTMRGQTLASLLVISAFHIMLHNNTKASIALVNTRMIPHYRRLGYRQIDKSLRLEHHITQVPMVLCPNDYTHLLQVMSPFALSLTDEQDDHGETAQILFSHYDLLGTSTKIIPHDIGTFWAIFADTYTRITTKRPGLFDERNTSETQIILQHADVFHINAGDKIVLPKSLGNIFGVITKGLLGDGVKSAHGHHWFEIYREGDALVILNQAQVNNAELIALEDSEIAILPENFLTTLKSSDPILTARLSMSMLDLMQQRITEFEDDSIILEEERVFVHL